MTIKAIEKRLVRQYPFLESTFIPEQPTVSITMQWNTAEDERVCIECMALDKQQFPIGQEPEIPVHINCRCTLSLAEIPIESFTAVTGSAKSLLEERKQSPLEQLVDMLEVIDLI